MKKDHTLIFSIVSIVLLISSFPIRDLLGSEVLSVICRIVGFMLVLIVCIPRNR